MHLCIESLRHSVQPMVPVQPTCTGIGPAQLTKLNAFLLMVKQFACGSFHQVQTRFVTASLFASVNWHHLLSFTVTSELASEYLPVQGTH